MEGHQDLLLLAKELVAKCKAELDAIMAEKAKFESKAAELKAELAKLKKVMDALTGGKKQKPAKKVEKKAAKKAVKKTGAKKAGARGDSATKYMLKVIAEASAPMKADQILTAMNAAGWQSKSAKPLMVVRNTLINLKKKKHVVSAGRGLFAIAK